MRFKVAIVMIILVLAVTMFITGCSNSNSNEYDSSKNRLQAVERTFSYSIGYDVKTKVLYLFGNHGLIVMVDEEGNPLLYDESDFSD